MRSAKRRALIAAAATAGLVHLQLASAADRTWSGGASDNNWSSALNWLGGVAPAGGDVLNFDGFVRLSPNNDSAAGTTYGGLNFAASAGAFTLGGNSITLGGDINDNTPVLTQTVNLALALNATRNVTVADTGFLTLGGVVSGSTFGLNKLGTGTLTLTGANTFTGPLSINAGVVVAGSDANTGAGNIVINGGTLRSSASYTLTATRGVSLGNAGGGSGSISLATGNAVTYNGVIANAGAGAASLVKYGFGRLNLSGANTYTGTTRIQSGTIALDFSAASAPVNNIISSSSNLVLGGSTAGIGSESNAALMMIGKAAATNVQSFASTNIDIYGSVGTVTNGAGGTATVNLGALTHNVGGTMVFVTNSGAFNTTTTVAATKGILGGWAIAGTPNVQRNITMGSDWATVDGTGKIVPYAAYVAAPIYDGTAANTIAGNATVAGNADKNLLWTGTAAATEARVDAENANTTTDINTLAFTTAGANNVLTIGTGNTLRLGQYGGIFKKATGNNQIFIGGTGGTTFTAGPTANAGHLTAGGAPNTPGEIVVALNDTANNNGNITIVSDIVDNGTGAVSVIKTSVASAKFDGHNTYSGGTYINQGRFQLAGSEQLRNSVNTALTMGNPDGLGTGPVFIAPGAYLFNSGVNGTGTYTGNGAIAGALPGTAQNAPIVNNITMSGNGTAQENGGAIRQGARCVWLGQITLAGDTRINAGAAYAYPAINADGTTLYVDPGNEFRGRITGPFAIDFGGRAVAGFNGLLTNPSNDWGGTTRILATNGNSILRIGANEVIPNGAGKGNVVMGENTGANVGVLDLNGFNETINGLSTEGGTTISQSFVQNNGFNATISGTVGSQVYNFTPSTSTLTVGDFNQTTTFGGIIRDFDTAATVTVPDPNTVGATLALSGGTFLTGNKVAVTKIGGGIQTLSGNNTYTGDTNVNAGVLSITGTTNQTAIKVNTGGTLGGNGSVGSVTVNSGGHLAPGTSIGTIQVGSLDVKSGADLAIEIGAGIADNINVSGAATFAASTITPSGVPTAGTYTILNAAGGLTLPGVGTITVNPLPSIPNSRGANVTLNTATPNQLNLVVTGGAFDLAWTGATNATWDVGNTGTNNWKKTSDNSVQKFFQGDTITFGDGPTNRNVALSAALGALKPGSINFSSNGANDYTLSGAGWLETDIINKTGSARVTLSNTGPNNIGTVTVGAGTFTLANSNTIGTISVNGGTLEFANTVAPGSISRIVNGSVVSIGNGTPGVGDAGSTAITNNNQIFFNRPDDGTVAGVISGGGVFIKNGAGTATLSGVNSYTGQTLVNSGTIKVTNSNSLGDLTGGGGPVDVLAGAAIDLGGNGTANQLNFSNANNGKSFNIRGNGPTGLGAIVNSGTLAQQNAFQRIQVVEDASIGGTARFDIRGAANTDPFNNPNTAQLQLNFHVLTKNGTNQFSIFNTDVGDGTVVLNSGTLAIESSTNMAGNGQITVNSLNAGTFVALQFFQNIGNLARDVAFNTANGGTILMGNNSNTLATVYSNMAINGSTTVNVQALNTGGTGSLVLNGALSGAGGINKSSNSTLVMNGTSTYTGGTQVDGGTLHVSTGGIIGPGNLGAGTGGFANFVAGRTDAIKVAGVSASGTGQIDVNDNDMIVGSNTTLAGVGALIASARNGGAWNGGGLTSSTARNTPNTGLGAISGADYASVGHGDHLFDGTPFVNSDTVVKYTWMGDANLDGRVTFDDYVKIDTGFNTGLTGWFNGDFNYSGAVTFDDYVLIDISFNQQTGTLGRAVDWISGDDRSTAGLDAPGMGEVIDHLNQFGSAYGAAFLAAVPEPATAGALGAVAAATLLGRRRRRQA